VVVVALGQLMRQQVYPVIADYQIQAAVVVAREQILQALEQWQAAQADQA
jgi:hypothetical protein